MNNYREYSRYPLLSDVPVLVANDCDNYDTAVYEQYEYEDNEAYCEYFPIPFL